MSNIFEQGLDKNSANFTALSPVSFVERSAEIFGDLTSVIHGQRKYTWSQTRERSARLASALKSLGIARGSTVSAMLPNTPEMVEVHYAVPALNAVLNALNTRLDAALIAWQLNHCESQVLITDREYSPVIQQALAILKSEHKKDIVVIDVCDSEYTGPGDKLGSFEYEDWLNAHPPLDKLEGPQDEWDAIAVIEELYWQDKDSSEGSDAHLNDMGPYWGSDFFFDLVDGRPVKNYFVGEIEKVARYAVPFVKNIRRLVR